MESGGSSQNLDNSSKAEPESKGTKRTFLKGVLGVAGSIVPTPTPTPDALSTKAAELRTAIAEARVTETAEAQRQAKATELAGLRKTATAEISTQIPTPTPPLDAYATQITQAYSTVAAENTRGAASATKQATSIKQTATAEPIKTALAEEQTRGKQTATAKAIPTVTPTPRPTATVMPDSSKKNEGGFPWGWVVIPSVLGGGTTLIRYRNNIKSFVGDKIVAPVKAFLRI